MIIKDQQPIPTEIDQQSPTVEFGGGEVSVQPFMTKMLQMPNISQMNNSTLLQFEMANLE